MPERWIGFLIWAAVGLLMIGIGVHAFFAKKPQHFWANVKMGKVTEIKKYNAAVGRLFGIYGVLFILLGLPLLCENEGWVLLSCFGVVPLTIAMMAIYAAVIEPKYVKK